MNGDAATPDLLAHGAAEGLTLGGLLAQTVLLVGLVTGVGAAYLVGAQRLVTGAATGSAAASWAWRRYSFLAGLLVLLVALWPQLDPVVEESFPLHMAQHIVLLLVAAPLLALGAPGLPLTLALPRHWRRRVAAVRGAGPVRRARLVATLPALVVVGHAGVVLSWHLPTLYEAALTSTVVHMTEHAAFLAVGWWFWSLATVPVAELDGRTVLYVFISGLPMNGLGAVLTFAGQPLYPAQTGTGPAALSQQQLAGVLMWIPSGLVYLALCAVLMLLWLRRLDRESPADAPLPAPVVPPPPLPGRLDVLTTTNGEVAR